MHMSQLTSLPCVYHQLNSLTVRYMYPIRLSKRIGVSMGHTCSFNGCQIYTRRADVIGLHITKSPGGFDVTAIYTDIY